MDPSSSACTAYSSSGHAQFEPFVLYGNFTVVAQWFPDDNQTSHGDTSTATGFIGLDSPHNTASITMGFHGEGWQKGPEGKRNYQMGIYADVNLHHNQERVDVAADLSSQMNTFGLLWTPDEVVWSFNGEVVRKHKVKSEIPQIPMQLRLHSRSGFGDEMTNGASFTASFERFEYEPWSGN